MVANDDKPVLHFATADEWRDWLADHHTEPGGVRLMLRKKGSALPGIGVEQALDEALCVGWIDGQRAAFDEHYFLQAYSPRRARSPWSQINRDHVARLAAEGRMRPSGLAEVDQAKADGRWDAAYRQKTAEVPPDLQASLDANPAAATLFATLSSQNRFAILFRVGSVTRASTRAAKIDTFVAMLARGETIYPQ
ncbi:YdeI family protein [Lacisediminihabitans sp.]|uniref:YdeI/OmpD-associated family protein n=1 Tax=Lacisediminihabitans sp. TaxID=2787631 RepID=UPI00374CE0B6